mgnify:CR=1 FL=1
MSIIQHIREKYAAVIIVAIAISLIAFILMDAFVGRGRGSGAQNSSTIAKINGQKVDVNVFRERLDEQEQQYQQSGMKIDDRGWKPQEPLPPASSPRAIVAAKGIPPATGSGAKVRL